MEGFGGAMIIIIIGIVIVAMIIITDLELIFTILPT